MGARSLSSLIAEIRQRTDQENSDFVSDAELGSWVNQSAADYYDLVLDYADHDALLAKLDTDTSSIVGDTLTVPSAYRLRGVDVRFDGRYRPIDRLPFAERDAFEGVAGWSSPGNTKYMLGGLSSAGVVQILFVPPPPAGSSIGVRVWYLLGAPTIDDAGSNLLTFNGWDEYVVADVCAKVVEKEEGDTRPHITRREGARLRIVQAAKALDTGGVRQMRDFSGGGCDFDEGP